MGLCVARPDAVAGAEDGGGEPLIEAFRRCWGAVEEGGVDVGVVGVDAPDRSVDERVSGGGVAEVFPVFGDVFIARQFGGARRLECLIAGVVECDSEVEDDGVFAGFVDELDVWAGCRAACGAVESWSRRLYGL